MTDRPTDIDDVLNHRRDACQKPLDMSDAAQAAELARLRRLEEAASTMYYTNHGSPEWDTAYNMLMEAIDEREEAAREAEKARGA